VYDFRGIEIIEGDIVAYVSGGRYTDRYTAKVVGFTPKMLRIVPVDKLTQYEANPKYNSFTVYPDNCWVLDRKGAEA